MHIRLVALDLDDTLLRSDLTISGRNLEAIGSAIGCGIRIVLASGRTYASMKGYARLAGLERRGEYLICSNGAELREADTGLRLETATLDPGFCRAAVGLLDAYGYPWQIYEEGTIVYSRMNPWTEADSVITGQVARRATAADLAFGTGTSKIVVPGDPAGIATLLPELRAAFGDKAEVLTSKPHFLEILPPGVDKGASLGKLAAHLGIERTQVMAIGDAMNDLGMIEFAGWGCAPANASREAKAVARIVSPYTNDQDAVASLIETMVLSGEGRRDTR